MFQGLKATALAALLTSSTFAATVNFVIQPGTGSKPWNTPDTVINLKVGDVLHLVNKDTVDHAIHTNNSKPFKHTDLLAPGEDTNVDVLTAWDLKTDKPLYDHFNQETGFVYVNVTE